MKVAVFGSYAPSLVNFRGELIRDMVRAGHEVTAMAPPEDHDIGPAVEALGAAYVPVSLQRTGMNPLRDALSMAGLVRTFRRIRPDAILSYTVKPVVYGSIAARLAGVPSIFSMITGLGYAFGQGGTGRTLLFNLVRLLYKIGLSVNKGVFFQNEDDSALFRSLGLVSASVPCTVTNGSGVDVSRFSPQPIPNDLSFLCVSRLLKEKGVVEYVHASAMIRKKYPHIRCVLVGPHDPGPDSVPESEVERWKYDDMVEYHGPASDVRPCLAESAVYVLPSYREGTPRSVLEAMSTGRAVVTTDAVGCRETVEPGRNGFLVPVRDAAALAEAMERFVKEPGLVKAMGRESRTMAEDRYDVRKVNRVIMRGMGLA